MNTAKAIKTALKQKNVSQSELARRLGTTPSAVCQICNNDDGNASTQKMIDIAAALGMDFIELAKLGQ